MQIDEGFDFADFAEYFSHDEFYKWKLNIYFGSNCITELLVEKLKFLFTFQVPIAKSHKDRKLKEPKLSLVRLFFQEKLIGVILPLFFVFAWWTLTKIFKKKFKFNDVGDWHVVVFPLIQM